MSNAFMNQYRQPQSRIMTVTGYGTISVEPNIVRIQLEVRTEDMQLSQAQQENASIMNQVMQVLVQLGIPQENIQTTAYNINPMYDFTGGKQIFQGYEVSNIITVKINNINQAGRVIDIAVQNGVNRVSNIQFSLKDNQAYYEQALSAALNNAFAKAQTIAETLKLSFDPKPIKIDEEMSETPPEFTTFASIENNLSTPIEPGKIIINAAVKMQFQY